MLHVIDRRHFRDGLEENSVARKPLAKAQELRRSDRRDDTRKLYSYGEPREPRLRFVG